MLQKLPVGIVNTSENKLKLVLNSMCIMQNKPNSEMYNLTII
jgi:hypothetical protein